MIITLNKKRKIPYYHQIVEQIRRMILKGELPDGAVLPSERKLADRLDVHRNTVIRAYGSLKDMGLVKSVRGKGYEVSCGSVQDDEEKPKAQTEFNWSQLIKDEYQDMEEVYDDIYQDFSQGSRISLSTGIAPFVYPKEDLEEDIARIIDSSALLPAYTAPYQGDLFLRQNLRDYFRLKGIGAGAGNIQVLTETNQALDFIIMALIRPGDCVFVEEPCSPDVYRVIALSGGEVFPIPIDEDGMVLDNLDRLIRKKSPKFIYVNSSYQDPTGHVMSIERRKMLLELSGKHSVPIVEDDAGSELYYDGGAVPSIKSMDRTGSVIYIYSFSLTFLPGISIAAVVANKKLIHSLSYLVSIRVISVSWLNQLLIAYNLQDGRYYKRVEEIRKHTEANRDLLCSRLELLEDIGVKFNVPDGGVYVWVSLPYGMSGMEVARAVSREGVSIVPGELFYPLKNGGKEKIRLSFSYESAAWLAEGADRLIRVIRKLYKEKKNK